MPKTTSETLTISQRRSRRRHATPHLLDTAHCMSVMPTPTTRRTDPSHKASTQWRRAVSTFPVYTGQRFRLWTPPGTRSLLGTRPCTPTTSSLGTRQTVPRHMGRCRWTRFVWSRCRSDLRHTAPCTTRPPSLPCRRTHQRGSQHTPLRRQGCTVPRDRQSCSGRLTLRDRCTQRGTALRTSASSYRCCRRSIRVHTARCTTTCSARTQRRTGPRGTVNTRPRPCRCTCLANTAPQLATPTRVGTRSPLCTALCSSRWPGPTWRRTDQRHTVRCK